MLAMSGACVGPGGARERGLLARISQLPVLEIGASSRQVSYTDRGSFSSHRQPERNRPGRATPGRM